MGHLIVTGGAGFIGSHLTRRLVDDGHQVNVLDSFLSGRVENLAQCAESRMTVKNVDLRNPSDVVRDTENAETVFHFAADPDVRTSATDPSSHYENNVLATFNVLEAMRLNDIHNLVFASSSVVYGEAEVMPTPEDHPLAPISIYGATKLACENLIAGYVRAFGIRALILRPANIIGSNGTHGVILDFIKKLEANPKELEILGDGTQCKSYLHISDCIDAVMESYQRFAASSLYLETYNVGSHDMLTVMEIARTVSKQMKLEDIHFKLTGGVEGGRGWIGDVKTMQLSVSKLMGLGWQPSLNSREAVELATSELLHNTN